MVPGVARESVEFLERLTGVAEAEPQRRAANPQGGSHGQAGFRGLGRRSRCGRRVGSGECRDEVQKVFGFEDFHQVTGTESKFHSVHGGRGGRTQTVLGLKFLSGILSSADEKV